MSTKQSSTLNIVDAAKSAVKPIAASAATKPVAEPAMKPAVVPAVKPAAVPAVKPVVAPATKPATAAVAKPATAAVAKPVAVPATKPVAAAVAKPVTAAAAKPATAAATTAAVVSAVESMEYDFMTLAGKIVGAVMTEYDKKTECEAQSVYPPGVELKLPRERELSIMSFNLGTEINNVSANELRSALKIIGKMCPDVIGLQGVTESAYRVIVAALHKHQFTNLSRHELQAGRTPFGTCIAVKKSLPCSNLSMSTSQIGAMGVCAANFELNKRRFSITNAQLAKWSAKFSPYDDYDAVSNCMGMGDTRILLLFAPLSLKLMRDIIRIGYVPFNDLPYGFEPKEKAGLILHHGPRTCYVNVYYDLELVAQETGNNMLQLYGSNHCPINADVNW